nr:hypothetical protein [Tanacetum cinerariifolium]
MSVETLGVGPSEPDPKGPPEGMNIFHTTTENHTANHIPESTSENASRDPVMQFAIQNFEQINAMYSTFSLKRKEVHPTSIPKTDDHPVMKPWQLDLEGLTKRADQEAPKDNTPPDNPTNRGKVAAENPA